MSSPTNSQVIGTDDPQGASFKIEVMTALSTRRSARRPRRHGVMLEPADRRELERRGWRTTLEYRETHLRSRGGRLLQVIPIWTAEAESYDGDLLVASADGATTEEAWARLLAEIEADHTRSSSGIRLLRGATGTADVRFPTG